MAVLVRTEKERYSKRVVFMLGELIDFNDYRLKNVYSSFPKINGMNNNTFETLAAQTDILKKEIKGHEDSAGSTIESTVSLDDLKEADKCLSDTLQNLKIQSRVPNYIVEIIVTDNKDQTSEKPKDNEEYFKILLKQEALKRLNKNVDEIDNMKKDVESDVTTDVKNTKSDKINWENLKNALIADFQLDSGIKQLTNELHDESGIREMMFKEIEQNFYVWYLNKNYKDREFDNYQDRTKSITFFRKYQNQFNDEHAKYCDENHLNFFNSLCEFKDGMNGLVRGIQDNIDFLEAQRFQLRKENPLVCVAGVNNDLTDEDKKSERIKKLPKKELYNKFLKRSFEKIRDAQKEIRQKIKEYKIQLHLLRCIYNPVSEALKKGNDKSLADEFDKWIKRKEKERFVLQIVGVVLTIGITIACFFTEGAAAALFGLAGAALGGTQAAFGIIEAYINVQTAEAQQGGSQTLINMNLREARMNQMFALINGALSLVDLFQSIKAFRSLAKLAKEGKLIEEAEKLEKFKLDEMKLRNLEKADNIYKEFKTIKVEEFAQNRQLQKKIFQAAKDWRDEQFNFMQELLKSKGIKAEFKSILKRDNFEEFVEGVIKKCERKEYKNLSQMDDIVRGRVNTKSFEDTKKIFDEIKKGDRFRVVSYTEPRRPIGNGEFGYPRYHLIVEDSKTGLTHEWQIGTEAVTEVFEKEGVRIPVGLKLKEGMHSDLHDINYDIFKQVIENDTELANKFGIQEFCNKVDILAGKAGKLGDAYSKPELFSEIEKLHKEASRILQNLFDLKGAKYIEGFYH